MQSFSHTIQITHALLVFIQILLIILNPILLHESIDPLINVKSFLTDFGQLSESVIEIGRIVIHIKTKLKLDLILVHQVQFVLILVNVLIKLNHYNLLSLSELVVEILGLFVDLLVVSLRSGLLSLEGFCWQRNVVFYSKLDLSFLDELVDFVGVSMSVAVVIHSDLHGFGSDIKLL